MIELEVGKIYLDRAGTKHTLVKKFPNHLGNWIYASNKNKRWFHNGKYDNYGDNHLDLIKEFKMIDINKKYKTENGSPVEIIAIRNELKYPVVGILDGEIEQWQLDGSYNNNDCASSLDLIEILPYEDFKIDDKVLVKDNNHDSWFKRHFAGIDDRGYPMTFNDGNTSWTSKKKVSWHQCIKLETSSIDAENIVDEDLER